MVCVCSDENLLREDQEIVLTDNLQVQNSLLILFSVKCVQSVNVK